MPSPNAAESQARMYKTHGEEGGGARLEAVLPFNVRSLQYGLNLPLLVEGVVQADFHHQGVLPHGAVQRLRVIMQDATLPLETLIATTVIQAEVVARPVVVPTITM